MYYKIPEFRVHWKLFKLSNVGAKSRKYWSTVIDLAKLGFHCRETLLDGMAQTRAYHGSVETVLFLLLQLFRCFLLGPGLLGREYNDLNVLSDSETEQTRPVCMFLMSIAANHRYLVNRCHTKYTKDIICSVCPNHWPLLMVSIPLVTWQQHLGILFLTITALFLILLLFDDWYLLGTIIYLKGQELQTFLHHDNLQVSCLGS